MKKLVTVLLALAMAFTMVFATAASAEDGYKDSITWVIGNDQDILDPQNNVSNSKVMPQYYNGLLGYDNDGNVVCKMAESYEASEDKMTWTFHLRQDVYFHSGRHCTAHDFEATFDRLLNTENPQRYTSNASSFIDTAVATDDYTFVITLKEPKAFFLQAIAKHWAFVLNPEYIEKYGADLGKTAESVDGTGPFKCTQWDKGEVLKFEAFENYYEGAPLTHEIVMKIVPEQTSRAIAVETAQADIADGLPLCAALRVRDGALPSRNAAIDARQRQAECPLLPGSRIGAEGGDRAVTEEKIILKAEDVRTYFPVKGALGQTVKEVKAVDGVSLALRQGETYGLVGESGCGKSTLGRTLIRLLEPTSGKITLFDQDITHLSKKEMLPFRRDVQIVFQDPYTSLNPRQRVGDMLMEVLAIHHIGDKNERMARALDIMAQVGLRPEHFYRYPHEFSGGQRQRIGLARALILDPKIVVCDEPVSALDVSIQSQIINLLKELQRKRGLTYLFVAHDMSVIRYISDRVGVMYLGHLVEEGDTDEVFDHPQHPYTRTLMSAVPSIDPRDNRQRILLEGDLPSPIDPPSGCVFHTRCPWATEACKTASCELREVRAGHYAACSRGEQE